MVSRAAIPGYARRPTRVVRVGDVAVGGREPIRIQSMTTPATWDVSATVAQAARLVRAGCEIVRVTVPTTRDADALPEIRRGLAALGLRVPLVADIHFTPAVAMRAVEHVDKIRINPGNFADKKKFAVREYTDAEYAAELERIAAVFRPLVRRCLELGVAMRIGTNHGSLSDRIMNRHGDTPLGMVESALEFVRICEAEGYRELILSMKASNPRVVLAAYRLLAARMAAQGMDYPFHLGVTEAGEGEDGRIKSAIGIGALLEEGIGDTVRVSLTEDPVAEIPVARALVAPFQERREPPAGAPWVLSSARQAETRRPAATCRVGPLVIGGTRPVAVEVPLRGHLGDLDGLRREIDAVAGSALPEEVRADLVSVAVRDASELELVATLRRSLELVAPGVALSAAVPLHLALPCELLGAAHRLHVRLEDPLDASRRRTVAGLLEAAAASRRAVLLEIPTVELALEVAERAADAGVANLALAVDPTVPPAPLQTTRAVAAALAGARLETPIVLLDRPHTRRVHPDLGPAGSLGGLLCEGIGDAVQIDVGAPGASRRLAFTILQAARVRITRTDFISCPSCGRTLFDLETTTARIKARTAHLKGVKIAIMGCVVNGPGEMADADFGYVGWGEDRIALFVGKDIVERDVPVAEADERLVQLIKRHGRWVDPSVPAEAAG